MKKTHKELDREWSNFNLEIKEFAIGEAKRWQQKLIDADEYARKVKEAQKGKRVGYECTCLPQYKGFYIVDFLCEYCQAKHREDYYNSPG